MKKFAILEMLLNNPVIAIIRTNSEDSALALADACVAGGITALEVSLTTPGGLEVIRAITKRHGDNALVGAGTVLDAETARLAILSGSSFILSPSFNEGVIRTCNRYQIVSIPGVATATEVVNAMEAGADMIKVFPGEAYGPSYLKALLAPLPHAPLVPSGGVSLANVEEWFKAGAVAVGIGSSLSRPSLDGDYEKVTQNAQSFVSIVEQYRARRMHRL